MARRPRGEAAQKIIEAFAAVQARELSIKHLQSMTGLAVPTLRDNLKALARTGRVEIHRREDNCMWVSVPE